MSVTSGFFNSINGDRTYNAEQMSSIFDGIINDGVFANIGTAFSVQATTGNTVNVGTGRCWFDSTWLLNDATLPIELDDAEVLLDRIDAIVIEINHSESIRAGSIKVVNGTPSSTPVNPTMTHTDYINQYPIAYIMRSANSDSITQANITYTVGSNACPFVTGILSVVSIQNIVAQWENEFDTWLDSLSAMLDDNTAANLANQILELKDQFDTLAKEKKIYSELEDSTGEDTIDDSTGSPILGTTAMYSDDGTSESIPGTVTGGDPYKVGDTLTTARTDLGAKWLLCNGDILDRDLYPELANLFPNSADITGVWSTQTIGTVSGASITGYSMIYANGYYVIPFHNCVFYSSSLGGSWTQVNIGSGFKDATNILYENNKYYVFGASDSTQPAIASASNLDGPWTVSVLLEIPQYKAYRPFKAFMTNDTYYIGAVYSNGDSGVDEGLIKLLYTTDLDSTWTMITIDSSSVGSDYMCLYEIGCMMYVNDLYIVFAAGNSGSTAGDRFIKVLYKSSLTSGNWSSYTISTNDQVDSTLYLRSMFCFYVNEQYILFDRNNTVYYADNLSGPWSSKIVNNSYSDFLICGACYNDGLFTIVGYSSSDASNKIVMQSSSIDGPWTTVNVTISDTPYFIKFFDGSYVFDVANTSTDTISIAYASPGEIALPSISLSDKTYTYIRAKE